MSGNIICRLDTGTLLLCGFLFSLSAAPAHASSVYGYGVSSDGLGNAYVSGSTDSSLGGPNAGNLDAYVSKYDAAGNMLWTKQLGTSGYDESSGVSADGMGNVYISGYTGGSLGGTHEGEADAFVSKYDAAGDLQWTQQLGTYETEFANAVSADDLGNVYISGSTWGSLGGPNGGNTDVFVGKYDAAGDLQWTQQLGTSHADIADAVSADGLGNVYVSGVTRGSLGAPNFGGDDAFVSKYNAAGNLQWTRQLGTSNDDRSLGISADGLGNVYISGHTSASLGGPSAGSADAFVAKYDPAGNLEWTKQLGTPEVDFGIGVSADGQGNVYVSGFTDGSLGEPNMMVGRDAFVAKYDSASNFQWAAQFGVPLASVTSEDVSADGLGNLYVSGFAEGVGGANAFVAKYDAEGSLQWIRQLGDNEFVPEPGSWLLAALACADVLGTARARRRHGL
jgi:hypothetical protein